VPNSGPAKDDNISEWTGSNSVGKEDEWPESNNEQVWNVPPKHTTMQSLGKFIRISTLKSNELYRKQRQ
jgi:hypothetical protein